MVLVSEGKERLDKFLARTLDRHSRTKLAKLIQDGAVLVNGRPEKASFLLDTGMSVQLEEPGDAPAHSLEPSDLPIEIVFEDEFLLVVNKPRGLAAHPAASLKEPSLVNVLLSRHTPLSETAGSFRPGIVHRLDRETTGLMVVAKDDATHVHLARQIERKTAERRYFAVVAGNVERDRFSIDAPLGRSKTNRILMAVVQEGRSAVSHMKLIGRIDSGAVLGVRLETGRTHQIRVHLSAFGMPVLGDRLYAPKHLRDGPLQLHAAYLSFVHPGTNQTQSFYAEPDADFLGKSIVSHSDLDPF